MKEFLLKPFQGNNKTSRLLLSIYFFINLVVLYNAVCHDPAIGYDAREHILKIPILAQGRLPAKSENVQYCDPPLSALLPAFFYSLGSKFFSRFDLFYALKFAQLCNVLYSMVLTFYLLKLCQLIRPGSLIFRLLTLVSLGMMPVYYKSFAFFRPEPLLTFLAVYIVYKLHGIFAEKGTTPPMIPLGMALGCLILTKQQGLSFFPIIVLFAAMLVWRKKIVFSYAFKSLSISFLIALLMAGWFYLYNYKTYGSFMRKSQSKFSFVHQPKSFYFGLGDGKLFTDPLRPSFKDQLFPRFHSEFWGDYQEYFLIYGKFSKPAERRKVRLENMADYRLFYYSGWDGSYVSGIGLDMILRKSRQNEFYSNRYDMAAYLGRVNLGSLLPALIFVGGLVLGARYFFKFFFCGKELNQATAIFAFIFLLIIFNIMGFFWYLLGYPGTTSGNVKPTYLLHVFPFVAILTAEFLSLLQKRKRAVFWLVIGLLAVVFIHNLPTFFTRYILLPI